MNCIKHTFNSHTFKFAQSINFSNPVERIFLFNFRCDLCYANKNHFYAHPHNTNKQQKLQTHQVD